MTTKLTAAEVGQALKHKLGLDAGPAHERAAQVWELLRTSNSYDPVVARTANELGRLMADAVRSELGHGVAEDGAVLQSLWEAVRKWVAADPVIRTGVISRRIAAGLSPPAPRPESIQQPPPTARTPVSPPPPPIPLPPPAAWRYQPVPDAPERFKESEALTFPNPPRLFRGFGARVRGKKHKHDGTNCDDWFAFARTGDNHGAGDDGVRTGDWTVIAVADGAGSKRLSRFGARAATTEAVESLLTSLRVLQPAARTAEADWRAALAQATDGSFPAPDLERVRMALVEAMGDARAAVEKEATRLATDVAFNDPSGRPADVNDMACTLLLAVLQPVEYDGKPRHLVMTCQVGDGMIGVIHRNGTAYQLGAADSGGHAGETEFLTSANRTEPAALSRKTAGKLLDLQALLVMTDGVADDYFPGGEHLPRLWADLVVNGIPDLNKPAGDAPPEAAGQEYGTDATVVEQEPRPPVKLHASQTLAERLGTTVGELLKQPATLWAGRRPLPGDTPADRLRLWLDAYHVRGSFDDRTLVCVHREDLA